MKGPFIANFAMKGPFIAFSERRTRVIHRMFAEKREGERV